MKIYDRLDQILPRLQEKQFRENKGLGNEIGFYIFDYSPSDELLVRDHIDFIKKKINDNEASIHIREFDLYKIIIEVLTEKGYLNKVFKMEKQKGTEHIVKAVKNALRLTTNNDLVVEYIRSKVKENDIVFITGVGKAWPIIRSHTVLNTLHSVLDHVPLVMFFPGTYDGIDLKLFDEIKDDNYYRAFRLVER